MRGPALVPSPKFTAGLAAAAALFLAVVTAAACCFFCSCRYLARRRQRLQSAFAGRGGQPPGAQPGGAFVGCGPRVTGPGGPGGGLRSAQGRPKLCSDSRGLYSHQGGTQHPALPRSEVGGQRGSPGLPLEAELSTLPLPPATQARRFQ